MQMKQRAQKAYTYIYKFIRSGMDDSIGVYAAQSSFFIIISLIPFLVLILEMLRLLLPVNSKDISNILSTYLPSVISDYLSDIIAEVFKNAASKSLISVSAISALWLASRGVMSLQQGIYRVLADKKLPNYFYMRLFSVVFTLIFVAVSWITILFFGFGGKISRMSHLHFLPRLLSALSYTKYIIFPVALTLTFGLFYKFLPHFKTKYVSQLPGALFASLGWIGFSFAYSVYIEHFSNYTQVYGSLAALVFLMLWLYFCIYILLWGAEFNKLRSEHSEMLQSKK